MASISEIRAYYASKVLAGEFDLAKVPTADLIWQTFTTPPAPNQPSNYEYVCGVRADKFSSLKPIDPPEAQKLIAQLHTEALQLTAASHPLSTANLPEVAPDSSWHIVRISSPGTYRRPVELDPNYAPLQVGGFERAADDTAARLGILLAAKRAGREFSQITQEPILHATPTNRPEREKIRTTLLADQKISFVYTGDPRQTKQIARVIDNDKAFIPRELIKLLAPDIPLFHRFETSLS